MYEHHDVLIVGAGISGISAAVHIQKALPGTDYLILEKREAIGGTWDLFRYPGVRSDSDMYTLGFDFKPWEHTRAIGDGATIRSYLQEAAREQGVDQHIRYGYGVESAEWDSNAARWTVTARVADGEQVKLTANFLYFGAGYYSYENPYRPEFPGEQNFKGELFHAQLWPEDLDYKDKRVVVIGSGATAVTLVPALAKQAAHVTMLQRSPSYVLSLPGEDALANQLRKVLPKHVSYQITRGAHLLLTYGSWQFFRHQPERAAALLRKLQERQLPEDYPVDVHFKPRYKVWDERLCLVPDGDLFQALSGHNAEIVTDKIESFTETGIRLESGQELEADIIVAATGLNVQMLGGAQISVDGEPVDLTNAVAYKGAMFSGVPNLVNSFGYINASWTLKADLIARYVTRLLKYMERHDYDAALPLAPPEDQELHPFVGLQSGYIKRASLPKQGSRDPWVVHQSWLKDLKLLLRDTVDDEGVRFFKRNPGKLSGDDATLAQLDGGSDLGSPQDTKPGVRAGARSSSS